MSTDAAKSRSAAPAEQRAAFWCAVLATYLGTSMGSAVSLVLPIIALQLALAASQVQLVIGGYLLARVAMLRLAGSLCDVFGPHRIFIVGMALFSLLSLLCSLVNEPDILISLRVLQGAAAALLSPSSLLVLRGSVPPAREAPALTFWSVAGIAGQGCAPLLGGFLADRYGWSSIFVFCGIATALVMLAYLRLGRAMVLRPAGPGRAGVLLKDLGVSAVLVALALLINAGHLGLVTAILLLIVMLWLLSARHLLRQPGYLRAVLSRVPIVLTGLAGFAVVTIALLWGSYFIQRDLHQSALMYGISCLPFAALGIGSCSLADRFIRSRLYAGSFFCAGLAMLLAAAAAYQAEQAQSFMLAATVLGALGLGYGFINGAISAALLHTYPQASAGDAASVASLSKQFGQLLGVSAFAVYRDLSASIAGSDQRLFLMLGLGAALVLGCSALCAWGLRARQA